MRYDTQDEDIFIFQHTELSWVSTAEKIPKYIVTPACCTVYPVLILRVIVSYCIVYLYVGEIALYLVTTYWAVNGPWTVYEISPSFARFRVHVSITETGPLKKQVASLLPIIQLPFSRSLLLMPLGHFKANAIYPFLFPPFYPLQYKKILFLFDCSTSYLSCPYNSILF